MKPMQDYLSDAQSLLNSVSQLLDELLAHLAQHSVTDGRVQHGRLDEHQVEAYQLSVLYAQYEAATEMHRYAALGELESSLAVGFTGMTLQKMCEQLPLCALQLHAETTRITEFTQNSDLHAFLQATWSKEFSEHVLQNIEHYQSDGNYGLDEEHQLMREMFESFAEDRVKPAAEAIHREDLLIPEEIIQGAKELDCFGLSIPAKYGGFQEDPDNVGIVVVTEALSRGALIVGSLITRPEILSKALLKGGTEEQKTEWLPKLASGERFCAVAVTEPNFGSNVAGISTTAKPTEGGWLINGTKTWCTLAAYADALMVLVRTENDPALKHKGLSLLIAEKPSFDGHDFEHTQEAGGKVSGRAIATIGYRGMHSYEVSFEDYFVPDSCLIGGEEGRGKGFYMQMAGFSGGRLQTAARALGVMQAAFDEAKQYCKDRKVFDKALGEYHLSQHKLAQMAMTIQACRQLTYKAAKLMDEGKGQAEASMVKLFACRQAEWITREAQQLHGGMGYAEEYPVSRHFVDARVLSIFEGAEEVLALRVVIPALLSRIS